MNQQPTHPNLTIVSILLLLSAMLVTLTILALNNTFTPTHALERKFSNSYNQ